MSNDLDFLVDYDQQPVNKDVPDRELRWLRKRIGKITSSRLPDLMKSGTIDVPEDEYNAAYALYLEQKEAKVKGVKAPRKTYDVEFGNMAMNYMYDVRREMITGETAPQISAYALDFGKEHEPNAIEWLKNNRPDLTVSSCTNDDEEIVFNQPFEGFGDSPDGIATDALGKIVTIEIKCPVSTTKIEAIKEMSPDEALKEYKYQFCGHFLGDPRAEKLLYLIYDGHCINDSRPSLDPSRGIIFEYTRDQLAQDIEAVEKRIKIAYNHIKSGKNIRDINK